MNIKLLLSFMITAAALCGCNRKADPEDAGIKLTEEAAAERKAINIFSYNVMDQYYLWTDEIRDEMEKWTTDDNPVEKVYEIRYKNQEGKDIDRWTMVTDDYSGLVSVSNHVSTTYGMDFKLYYADKNSKAVYMVVTLVYPSSPAEKAGISRGSCFKLINGKGITDENYIELINKEFLGSPEVSITDLNGKEISLTAVEMYEDPVITHKIFKIDGKSVGYLFYNGFTLDSIKDLVSIASEFKSEGVTELILDLRYNSGGYVYAETALGSLLAPEAEVRAGSVFETNIYNKNISGIMGDSNTCFATSISGEVAGKRIEADLISANLDLKRLYVIMTESSASASESLITGLRPYTDTKIFGSQSHGKFCTGLMISAKDWYEGVDEESNGEIASFGKYAGNWGIYVMIGRFADKDGNSPCMPDGFKPDFDVVDNPTEPYQLGDTNEAMLKAVISYIQNGDIVTTKASGSIPEELPAIHDNSYGRRIMTLEKDGLFQ